tara:strand:- start:2080 stop:2469 length:390 start_codon:yes stop_codon:yes gene_type:complete
MAETWTMDDVFALAGEEQLYSEYRRDEKARVRDMFPQNSYIFQYIPYGSTAKGLAALPHPWRHNDEDVLLVIAWTLSAEDHVCLQKSPSECYEWIHERLKGRGVVEPPSVVYKPILRVFRNVRLLCSLQ